MYKINTVTGAWVEYDMPYFYEPGNPDIHCNLSPDGRFIVGDGYPHDGYRALTAYKLENGDSCVLLRAKTVIPKVVDIRCDLHVRYVWGGKYMSFDTTHNDRREIAILPCEVLEEF